MNNFVKFLIVAALVTLFSVCLVIEWKRNEKPAGAIPLNGSKASYGMLLMDTLEHDGHKWVAGTRRGGHEVAILHHPDCQCFARKPTEKK